MKRLLLLLILAGTFPVNAEIEKFGRPCETGLCLYWRPKLAPVEGWHHEPGPSQQYGANALAPDGSTFMDAETVMYAKAFYKPRITETKSLEALIENDKRGFLANVPGVVIANTKPLSTGDGKKLKSVTFFPTSQGNWERVSYGEEGEFYLLFTVSSRTKAGYEKALPAYEAMIRGYKERL
jgi:hypothetical protein